MLPGWEMWRLYKRLTRVAEFRWEICAPGFGPTWLSRCVAASSDPDAIEAALRLLSA